ncbi:carbohydrate ABC transporter permease [Vallitalea sp.]|jgi:multiple sugar transport system permease protein|uniref:carbohydrate ABC transporter permease n=1 Tax=Vallitalea sp. TaxID=1882829 RepID=UPI0025DAB3C2|nr:sugar ABC transporter permease [Vallitalea sp.]MCT4685726.1 sugar ABC transporter permease [Vallitalea sp.]
MKAASGGNQKSTRNFYKKMGREKHDRIFAIMLLLPAIIVVGFTTFFPIAKSVIMSFFNYKLKANADYYWNDFLNYKELFQEGEIFNAIGTTFKFMIITVALIFVIGLILSNILNKDVKGRAVLRSVVLLPWIIPTIVTGLLWMWIFQPQYGVLNYLLMKLNIISDPINWVASMKYALYSVVTASVWRQIPFITIMLLAGMQGIPSDLYEAATIDGANSRQCFFKVTLPMLSNVIKSTLLISIITNFKQFPLFWIMTGGGPVNKTTTLAIMTYKNSFVNLNFGKGAAVSTIWLIILIVFSAIYNKAFKTARD